MYSFYQKKGLEEFSSEEIGGKTQIKHLDFEETL